LLRGERDDVALYPPLNLFVAAQRHNARHASIRLPFEAAAEAALIAQQRHLYAA
jgi:hypothetical protein